MIHRVIKDKDNPYVIMNKDFLENPNLSLKAKGLLSYLLSKPDNWKIIMEDLVKKSTNGRESVSSAIRELIEIGYIHRIQTREDNKFGPYEYHIYEQPRKSNEPADGIPTNGKPVYSESATNNNNLTNNDKVSIVSSSFLKNKKEEETKANQGFAPESASNSSKVVLNLRKKPSIAEPIIATPSKAEEIRNKKTTLAKPPPDPINVPSTIQEYLDT
jgi:predicted transcriptional regulator